MQWNRFDSIARQGHAYACEVLDGMTAEQLGAFRTAGHRPDAELDLKVVPQSG
ncbi:hypothetical protein [Rhodoferax sediminis]|jgi:hypothetical protein|uniref:hypothetical protein n=1 Tax=Rhodoferax sediminis TaxID=2509614 RepID=UPI00143DA70B|nr:hypothetical protein [Rhodoferax sediminis]